MFEHISNESAELYIPRPEIYRALYEANLHYINVFDTLTHTIKKIKQFVLISTVLYFMFILYSILTAKMFGAGVTTYLVLMINIPLVALVHFKSPTDDARKIFQACHREVVILKNNYGFE